MRPDILEVVESYGFKVFEDGDYDLNIIAIRNPYGKPDKFDDEIAVVYKVHGRWQEERFRCTTDPGLYWLRNPGRVRGTAILKHPQQCRSAYTLRPHRGTYICLGQRAGHPVTVWRDSNLNDFHDMGVDEERGTFGINVHRASAHRESTKVQKWSAGCCVLSDPDDYDRFIELCRLQESKRGWKTFTLTIIKGEAKSL